MQPMQREFWQLREFEKVRKLKTNNLTVYEYFLLCRHSLKQHYIRKSKLHECYCGSVYKNKLAFLRHQTGHFEENISCEVCKRILTSDGFERHWRIHHLKALGPPKMAIKSSNTDEKSKSYSFLSFGILFISAFIISVMILNQEGPFICDKCGVELIDRMAFFEHLKQK